ncbi:hypothetical protein [Nocardia vaccinii]|uniref:hypothetical protein n=1 Tax=Nocardia vaccinii TaxID=1822 RepID=UPI00082A416C|nr:hypothetical protein [Nocardia vaccinii]
MRSPKSPERYDPFEVVLCAVFGISVLLQCFYGSPANSAVATLPPGLRKLWLGLTLTGCLTTLVGVFARRVWGYLIEQIGLGALGWSLVAFGTQLLMMQIHQQTISAATILGGPLPIALGIAFLWKRRQVSQELKTLRAIRTRRTAS